MRRNTMVLVYSAALACGSDDASGEGGDVPGHHGEEGIGDEGDGDGDDHGEEVEPYCDLSQFPRLVPEWIVEAEDPLEDGHSRLEALEVTADAMFIAGAHFGDLQTGYLERWAHSGELEWSLDLPTSPSSIAWDGSHIYALLGREVRRWTATGVEDGWHHDLGSFLLFYGDVWTEALAVDDDSVVVVANVDEGFYEPDNDQIYMDTYYEVLGKTVPVQSHGGVFYGIPEVDERVHEVVKSPWGDRWIAAGYTDYPGHAWLVGLADFDFHASLHLPGSPRVVSLVDLDDTIIMLSRIPFRGMWLSSVSSAGDELWSTKLPLCGDVEEFLWQVVEHEGALWAIGRVPTAPDTQRPLLMRLNLEGAVEQVYALGADGDDIGLSNLEATDSGIYVGGRLENDEGPGHRVIGKVVFP